MVTQTIEDKELPLITFNTLYSLLREEKKSTILKPLPAMFYEAYNQFISEKHELALKLMRDKENSKAMKEQKIIMSSENTTNELFSLRMSKISALAIRAVVFPDDDFSTKNILEEEMKYFEEFSSVAKKSYKLIN